MMLYESLLYLLFWLLNFCFFSGVSIFSKFLLCFSYLLAYMCLLISLPLCFFCFFGSWFVQIFKLIGSLHIAKSRLAEITSNSSALWRESQKPVILKSGLRIRYCISTKSATTWETLSSWTTIIRYNLAICARNKPR